jgi:hypothetical protein
MSVAVGRMASMIPSTFVRGDATSPQAKGPKLDRRPWRNARQRGSAATEIIPGIRVQTLPARLYLPIVPGS